MPVALRVVSDVSNVTGTNHACHFTWQAQYLVRLEGDACCSAQCEWRFNVTKINDAIHSAWQVTLVDGTCCSAHCN